MQQTPKNRTADDLLNWGAQRFVERAEQKGVAVSDGALEAFKSAFLVSAKIAARRPSYFDRYWGEMVRSLREQAEMAASAAQWEGVQTVEAAHFRTALEAHEMIKGTPSPMCNRARKRTAGSTTRAA